MHTSDEILMENAFILGEKRIQSLPGLLAAIEEMSSEEFSHFVGENHNYFVPWIKDILHEDELAGKLDRIKSREGTATLIKDYLKGSQAEGEKKEEDLPRETFKVIDKEEDYVPIQDLAKEEEPVVIQSEKKSKSVKLITRDSQGNEAEEILQEVIEEQEPDPKGDRDTEDSKSPFAKNWLNEKPVQGRHLYSYHMGREVSFSFFVGLIFGILIGMILAKMLFGA